MTRDQDTAQKIALLATGDEIINGDILNTNSKEIAHLLFDLGMHVGMHAASTDQTNTIEEAIAFLLQKHDALIMTGGLGPTSDDLTRYALSKATDKPLVFHQATWDNIVARLKHFGYDNPPESNRQQALFPETATIIPNPNGTAAGCFMEHLGKLIFMLPGPPSECLPMVNQIVLPLLTQKKFSHVSFRKSWLLFSVSEGQIAEEFDELAKPYDCITGYRIAHPYLEFKIHSNHEKDFLALSALIDQKVAQHLISDGVHTASEMLKTFLETISTPITIYDSATGGLLESFITTPKTRRSLEFCHEQPQTSDHPTFIVTGLTEYWQQQIDAPKTSVTLIYQQGSHSEKFTTEAPNRGDRSRRFAVEWISYHIRKQLLAKT